MGLAPLTRPLGQTPQTGSDRLYLIPLSSCPILGGDKAAGSPSGVVFTGRSFEAASENSLSCCGRYNFNNSLHQGVAGMVDDGSLIFAVNSWVSGRRCTVMGAFDPLGKPVAPTKPQQDLLAKYFPTTERPIVLDTKAKSDIGFRTNGANPNVGVYVGNKTIIFDVHARLGDDSKRYLEGGATVTTDFDGKVTGQAYTLTAKDGNASLGGGYERKGTQTIESVNATWDKWSLAGKRSRDGANRDRQLDLSFRASERMTIKASWRPDVKPPSTPPRMTSYSFDKPPVVPNYSQYMITLEIKLP
ncbi:hypothetical protein [Rhizobium sp. P44RR-XXIV]|uniref:hypothetical protein n=1 Tax=Rhizobium sp. P44RR-XXIV TaxID=1921145 RepID=UPI0010AB408D|nr:hypothetical protein [Rhizobium sp. P44RR-XXIV]TIX88454.1 hypothetical protein BSK43_017330 [Rhizobium sp. P44RR-XXIV]